MGGEVPTFEQRPHQGVGDWTLGVKCLPLGEGVGPRGSGVGRGSVEDGSNRGRLRITTAKE
jgi:hypothetical protein